MPTFKSGTNIPQSPKLGKRHTDSVSPFERGISTLINMFLEPQFDIGPFPPAAALKVPKHLAKGVLKDLETFVPEKTFSKKAEPFFRRIIDDPIIKSDEYDIGIDDILDELHRGLQNATNLHGPNVVKGLAEDVKRFGETQISSEFDIPIKGTELRGLLGMLVKMEGDKVKRMMSDETFKDLLKFINKGKIND